MLLNRYNQADWCHSRVLMSTKLAWSDGKSNVKIRKVRVEPCQEKLGKENFWLREMQNNFSNFEILIA